MPYRTSAHAIGQGRASCGGAHHCFGSKTKAMAEMMCARGAHEADRCKRAGRIAVRSDVAAATGPCGHANVEISDLTRRHWLPATLPRPASKSLGRFGENSGAKLDQTIP